MNVRRLLHGVTLCRLYSTGKLTSSGSALATLRKKTGYSISNCKKALQVNDNDVVKAEAWLDAEAQAQGWNKAAKLQNRATLQGAVGISFNKQQATMVEVNCETDFVARNEKFLSLVASVAGICLANTPQTQNSSTMKVHFSSEQLRDMKSTESSLGDLLALNIGQIGENMSLRRASALSSPHSEIKLAYCTHPMQVGENGVMLGKYGAIVAYQTSDADATTTTDDLPEEVTTEKLPRQLCQHIIGMKPRSIDRPETAAKPGEETALYHQELVANPDYTVGEILEKLGWKVHAFVRYECGEKENVESPTTA